MIRNPAEAAALFRFLHF